MPSIRAACTAPRSSDHRCVRCRFSGETWLDSGVHGTASVATWSARPLLTCCVMADRYCSVVVSFVVVDTHGGAHGGALSVVCCVFVRAHSRHSAWRRRACCGVWHAGGAWPCLCSGWPCIPAHSMASDSPVVALRAVHAINLHQH